MKIENTSGKEVYQLTYEEAIKQINLVKETFGNSELFGNEKAFRLNQRKAFLFKSCFATDKKQALFLVLLSNQIQRRPGFEPFNLIFIVGVVGFNGIFRTVGMMQH